MNDSDIEAQVTLRIKDALDAAIRRTGRTEFAKMSGIPLEDLDRILQSDGDYLSIAVITLACQINRTNGDPEITRSSISECLKGAIFRMPQREGTRPESKLAETSTARLRRARFFKTQKKGASFYDPTALRILGFSVNLFTFLVLGYFVGGIVLGPIFGLGSCIGVVATAPWVTPCAGSGVGIALGSVVGLGYTYYYFVKKL